ncbi:unnamed protein product [Vitrella brassicaformis CCMP3155]|uniref:VWFA domain-containing protein n=1 Tax=Vitrella brassicaformis (strain CCMP3155) TaxID=1169540 RepID=A0A0G4FQB0_VITBC|nr:unnamed protein product [Vitrella brassicaformis CCMP3155]|eukprot:CEM16021.1 unnamed protein product [Vitrella brassicaformis CCMP3155]
MRLCLRPLCVLVLRLLQARPVTRSSAVEATPILQYPSTPPGHDYMSVDEALSRIGHNLPLDLRAALSRGNNATTVTVPLSSSLAAINTTATATATATSTSNGTLRDIAVGSPLAFIERVPTGHGQGVSGVTSVELTGSFRSDPSSSAGDGGIAALSGAARMANPKEALQNLNDIIERTQRGLDEASVMCASETETAERLYEEQDRELTRLSSTLADAEARLAQSNANTHRGKAQIQELQLHLHDFQKSCQLSKAENTRKLNDLRDDLAKAKHAVGLSGCKRKNTGSAASLLQCHSPSGKAFLALDANTIQAHLRELKTPHALQSLQRALVQTGRLLVMPTAPGRRTGQLRRQQGGRQRGHAFVSRHNVSLHLHSQHRHYHRRHRRHGRGRGRWRLYRRHRHRHHRLHHHRAGRHIHQLADQTSSNNTADAVSVSRSTVLVSRAAEANDTTAPEGPVKSGAVQVDLEGYMKKCVVVGTPDCGQFNDNMAYMIGSIEAAAMELQAQMNEEANNCRKARTRYNEEIEDWSVTVGNLEAELAKIVAELKTLRRQVRDKELMVATQRRQKDVTARSCSADIKKALEEICGARRLRKEVAMLSGDNTLPSRFQDGQVSHYSIIVCLCPCSLRLRLSQVGNWTVGPCSKSCKTDSSDSPGQQVLTRVVVAPAGPMSAKCPQLELRKPCNDVMSSCSASCGGGVRQRIREVLSVTGDRDCTPPAQPLQDIEICNTASCSPDCKLGGWGNFSLCDKSCGGGFQFSKRPVIEEARSGGSCPGPRAHERLKRRPCNQHPCQDSIKCATEMDLVVLVDGSASMTAGGFSAVKGFLKTLIGRMTLSGKHVKAGLVLFHDMGVVASGLTADEAALKTAVGNLDFPAWTSNLAQAMEMTQPILMEGRSEAVSAVLVITDGKTNDAWLTKQASGRLRQRGVRVASLIIGNDAPQEEVSAWVSYPSSHNIVIAPAFEDLARKELVTNLIANLCPVVTS